MFKSYSVGFFVYFYCLQFGQMSLYLTSYNLHYRDHLQVILTDSVAHRIWHALSLTRGGTKLLSNRFVDILKYALAQQSSIL